MAIEIMQGDLARTKSHEPDRDFPDRVELRVVWRGEDGVARERVMPISADQFFGHGSFGAPMSGDSLVQAIERMRRQGAPAIPPKRSRSR